MSERKLTSASMKKLPVEREGEAGGLRSTGQLPEPMRLGGAVRWRLDEVKKWIADGCRKTK